MGKNHIASLPCCSSLQDTSVGANCERVMNFGSNPLQHSVMTIGVEFFWPKVRTVNTQRDWKTEYGLVARSRSTNRRGPCSSEEILPLLRCMKQTRNPVPRNSAFRIADGVPPPPHTHTVSSPLRLFRKGPSCCHGVKHSPTLRERKRSVRVQLDSSLIPASS
jgi:hypothetical protein